jgi:hypothetical protein
MHTINARFLVICGVILMFGSGVYAAGKYQRTEDRKTRVWNSNPRVKATATWSGDRDEDGYATGSGTLTWFRVDRKFLTGSLLPNGKYIAINHYTGKMVRGKFDGTVVTEDTEGASFHARFAKGAQKGEWAAGPAPTPKPEREQPARQDAVVEVPAEGPRPVPPPAAAPTAPPTPIQQPKQDVAEHQTTEKAVPPKPVAEKPVEKPVAQNPASEKPAEPNQSLRSLAAPPSSLRLNSGNEQSPQPSDPAEAASPAPTP